MIFNVRIGTLLTSIDIMYHYYVTNDGTVFFSNNVYGEKYMVSRYYYNMSHHRKAVKGVVALPLQQGHVTLRLR